jgi:hypothetical protein
MMRKYPALAVVACDGVGHGVVIWHLGLQHEIEDGGLYELSDLGLDDAPQGISVWDGHIIWTRSSSTPDSPAEDDCELVGEFRDPTPEEWACIQCDHSPFESRRCQHAEEVGGIYFHEGGQVEEPWTIQCDNVAVQNGLCVVHREVGTEQRLCDILSELPPLGLVVNRGKS